ncbi:aldehyde dehydrogenase family protein, partial [Streptomyces sp. SID1034]
MPIATVNPATGETLKSFGAMGPEEVERRLATAGTVFAGYRTTSFEQRARLVLRAAELLDADRDDIARTM